jgi:hypothetical protein
VPSAFATSVVVAAMPLLGHVQLDADAGGNAVLGWSGLRGDRWVVQTADVRDGRRTGRVRTLWRTRGGAWLGDLDVAPSGAAGACFEERGGRNGGVTRVRLALRSPGGAWSRPIVVGASRRFVDDVTCAVGDQGNAVVAWTDNIGAHLRAAAVSADRRVEPGRTLARDPETPMVAMAPDGSAIVGFATSDPDLIERRMFLARHAPGSGWSATTQVGAGEEVYKPELAVDGSGRTLFGWTGVEPWTLRLATGSGTAVTPATLMQLDGATLADLAAGARGDAIATYITNSPTGRRSTFNALLQRPGGAFGAPVRLGRLSEYPFETTLAADGTGAAVWNGGTDRRVRAQVRLLDAAGRWGPVRPLTPRGWTGLDVGLVTRPGGATTVAWLHDPKLADVSPQLRLALVTPD